MEHDKMIIVLDELKFDWRMSQLRKMIWFWEEGYSIQYITRYFSRKTEGGIKQIEIVLAIMHLEIEGFIESREGGLAGNKGE